MGFGKLLNIAGNNLGQKIGEGYAKQGKSWDEISSMPSSGSGFMSDAISSGAKTGYDNYMANNKPTSVSTSSGNMIQSSGGSDGGLATSGLATSAVGTGSEYDNKLIRGFADANMAINVFKKTQSQGDILGTQDIQPYDSQSNAQSMNVNPMLNNGLGSLGQNNTGGTGFSSWLDNTLTAQKSNGLGNIGYNPQGNNYNIIGGVELV